MSRDPRTNYYNRDIRNRDRAWDRDRGNYRYDKNRPPPMKRSRSPPRDVEKRRSRSPRPKNEKDLLDENILSEISKLPEPSELWDNQFQEFPPPTAPAPAFPPESSSYGTNYPPTYPSGIYDDFPSIGVPPVPHPPDMAAWNQMSLPPPPVAPTMFVNNVEDQIKKEAAIESEMRHQKAALSKQREDYIKKTAILKKELETLKDQRNELRGDAKRSPSPDTKRFLKENTKLQLEIQNKLKTINNVVDMLNGIIGEEAQEHIDSDDSNDRAASKRKSRSPSNKKFNYVYYDPEMHWCRVCNEFPPTAKDYLNHLHSPAHHKMAAAHMEAPWHTVTGVNEGFPSFPSAPTKRTPIRGLQFFVPSTAWYCKLCDQFIGDLHCASAHLKSITHSKNYTNFVEQNPHWETDWMSDRQKAFEKARASNKLKAAEEKAQYAAHTITFSADGFHTKSRDHPPPEADKKKKKEKKKKSKRKRSSSSSSSSSHTSDSEPAKKKKSKKEKQEANDKSLAEWMSSIQTERLNDHDRKLFDTFKNRIKLEKNESERRSAERAGAGGDNRKRDADRHDRRDAHDRRDEARRRDDRRDDRRDERRDDRRDDRRESSTREGSRPRISPRREYKKPEIRKMPFIGKMPVYKNLNKTTKTEEQKKDEQKKKEDEEASKKRREEMDAEIQKKVAEFKEKIAKAQLERAHAELPPPAVALPTVLGAAPPYLPPEAPPPAPAPAPPPPQPPPPAPTPALPKDFQEALDIIFPTEVKQAASEIVAQQELFGMPFPLGMPPFLQQPQLSILGQPPQMPMMMPFDMFSHRPQLYDTHVPLVPRKNNKSRQNQKNQNNNHNKNAKKQNTSAAAAAPAPAAPAPAPAAPVKEEQGEKPPERPAGGGRNKEELDELALLGIDASDVGAGM